MAIKILITGGTGLIGGKVLTRLLEKGTNYQITALIRPETKAQRINRIKEQVEIIPIDLTDVHGIRRYLDSNTFDLIVHIGALRGGRKFDRTAFYKANVLSTEQFIESAIIHQSRLLFCSSVGVFGTIPLEIPANNRSPKVPDSYYHYTKIEAEKRINSAILRGLNALILRPAITYGIGDYGFPYQMVRLVDKRLFPLLMKRIWIHLCHIETITDAFIRVMENEFENGLTLNIADREPVQMTDLINFISRELHKRNYSKSMVFDEKLFRLGERISGWLKNELWLSRFKLISHSWFFDVQDAYDLLSLTPRYTIPDFRIVVQDYLQ